jgi:hypothetical protein
VDSLDFPAESLRLVGGLAQSSIFLLVFIGANGMGLLLYAQNESLGGHVEPDDGRL